MLCGITIRPAVCLFCLCPQFYYFLEELPIFRNNPVIFRSKMESSTKKRKTDETLNTRAGGAYIPPAKLKMMQAQIADKSR